MDGLSKELGPQVDLPDAGQDARRQDPRVERLAIRPVGPARPRRPVDVRTDGGRELPSGRLLEVAQGGERSFPSSRHDSRLRATDSRPGL